MVMLVYTIAIGVLGIMIGSAVNAIVWRLHVNRSWVHGRSMCPDCKHALAARDLVPVVSWLWLRGKCRYCQKKILWLYPAVELLTAALFALSAAVLPPVGLVSAVRLGCWLLLLTMLVVLAVYDARWLILPDKMVLPLAGVALVYVVVMSVLTGELQVVRGAAEAAVLGGGGFMAIIILSKGRGMGAGDMKLAVAMGLMLGLKGLGVAMLVAFNVAAIVGLAMIIARKRKGRDQIPFGPYLVGGTIVAFLFAHQIVEWYLRINGVA